MINELFDCIMNCLMYHLNTALSHSDSTATQRTRTPTECDSMKQIGK